MQITSFEDKNIFSAYFLLHIAFWLSVHMKRAGLLGQYNIDEFANLEARRFFITISLAAGMKLSTINIFIIILIQSGVPILFHISDCLWNVVFR